MKNRHGRRFTRMQPGLIVLIALVCLCVLGATFGSILAHRDETGNGQTSTRSAIDRTSQKLSPSEVSNNALLSSLLSVDGISVDPETLLPAQVGSARTALVHFESNETSLSGDGFLSQRPASQSLSLIDVKSNGEGLTRQRTLELSMTEVLVLATNGSKQTLWWTLLPDPSLFRAETSDANGKLSGQKLYRTRSDMLVSYPADNAISELRFYHPSWDGQSFSLERIGTVIVPPTD